MREEVSRETKFLWSVIKVAISHTGIFVLFITTSTARTSRIIAKTSNLHIQPMHLLFAKDAGSRSIDIYDTYFFSYIPQEAKSRKSSPKNFFLDYLYKKFRSYHYIDLVHFTIYTSKGIYTYVYRRRNERNNRER